MLGALRGILPPQCLACGAEVTSDHGLCPDCWRETVFLSGLVCDLCGAPLPGEDSGRPEHCDDCLRTPRPWRQGRAALLYTGTGRRLVLALKHGDRLDLVPPLAGWMQRAAAPMLGPDLAPDLAPEFIVAPVPLHRWRLVKRRYNQSALLAGALARAAGLRHIPDLLTRVEATPSQEGRDRAARFANLEGAIRATPRRVAALSGARVLLVDDVLTSGATLAAASEACLAAGASDVSVLVLARVAKDA
jgi:predicted amidophosphoribosyltransferase